MKNGFLPVLHGDVVFGEEKIEVLSGDDIVVHMAEAFKAKKLDSLQTLKESSILMAAL